MKDRTKNTPQVLLRRALLVLLDAAIVAFSFYFALLLRADGAVEAGWWPHNRALLYENLPWIVAVYIVCFLAGGLYSVLWKYAGERDLIRLAGMIAVPTAVVYVVNRRFIHGVLFNSANCMASVLIFLFIGGSRLAWRLFLNHPLGERMRKVPAKDPHRPVLIGGAGEAGAWAINVCKSNKEYGHAVVAVDDDPAKLNQTIHGVPVKGTLEDIPELCNRYGIHSIIIAIPTLKGSKLSHVIDLCVSTHCAVQLLSDPQLVGSGAPQQEVFRELNPADFLSREEVTLDTDKISGYLTGKTVLVTGGGGSIGSELCRQVMRFKPGKLLIFDIYENCAYELQMELQQKYGRDIPVTVLIGSIRDKKRLDEVFDTYHPTVVFHAAAHKHVPLMEVSPAEAVKNNVLGTKNLLVSASEHGVERFVQLSTDKAVNPTSVMGCTKRICEMLIQTFAGNTDMKCVAVRFGNVNLTARPPTRTTFRWTLCWATRAYTSITLTCILTSAASCAGQTTAAWSAGRRVKAGRSRSTSRISRRRSASRARCSIRSSRTGSVKALRTSPCPSRTGCIRPISTPNLSGSPTRPAAT